MNKKQLKTRLILSVIFTALVVSGCSSEKDKQQPLRKDNTKNEFKKTEHPQTWPPKQF
ncbi:MAG: hypothetical protein PHT38_04185 [Halothiobacillus sp.]|nr:hypothetical protein [Halothiobacillus sp.]